MDNNKVISIFELFKFFYAKKVIILITILFTLICSFIYDTLEIGNFKHKAQIRISLDNQNSNLASDLFLFNYSIKRMINATDLTSIIKSLEGTEKYLIIDKEVMSNLSVPNADTSLIIKALSNYDFTSYNSEIDAYITESNENKIIYQLESYNRDALIKGKDEIYKKLKISMNNEFINIFNLAMKVNLELKNDFLNNLKQIKVIKLSEDRNKINKLKMNYFQLVDHINREIIIANELDIKSSTKQNDQNIGFISHGSFNPDKLIEEIEYSFFVKEIPFYFGFDYRDGYETLEIIKEYVGSVDIEKILGRLASNADEIDSFIYTVENLNMSKYDKILQATIDSLNFNYYFFLSDEYSDLKIVRYLIGLVSGFFLSFIILFSMFILKNEK